MSNISDIEKFDLLKKAGNRIKGIRNSIRYGQADLAVKMKGYIDTNNISRIEASKTNPAVYTLFRISQALDVPMFDFVNSELPK